MPDKYPKDKKKAAVFLNREELEIQAEFLFFLREYWYPYAAEEDKYLFDSIYDEETIAIHSTSCRWIATNREKVEILLSALKEPVTVGRFLKNIVFALGEGRTLKF